MNTQSSTTRVCGARITYFVPQGSGYKEVKAEKFDGRLGINEALNRADRMAEAAGYNLYVVSAGDGYITLADPGVGDWLKATNRSEVRNHMHFMK